MHRTTQGLEHCEAVNFNDLDLLSKERRYSNNQKGLHTSSVLLRLDVLDLENIGRGQRTAGRKMVQSIHIFFMEYVPVHSGR